MSLILIRKQHRENNGDVYSDLIVATEDISYIEGPAESISKSSFGYIHLKGGDRIKIRKQEYEALISKLEYIDATTEQRQEEVQSPIARF